MLSLHRPRVVACRCWVHRRGVATLAQLLLQGEAQLRASLCANRDQLTLARHEAQVLLAHTMQRSRHELLLLRPDAAVAPAQETAFLRAVARRALCEPLEYITRSCSFYGLTFECAPLALVPRIDSELLVERAVAALQAQSYDTVVDIGCGTGCLLLSVLANVESRVTGVGLDLSANALVLAQRNTVRHGLFGPRVKWRHSHWMDAMKPLDKPALLLCNPPYIDQDTVVDAELSYEPAMALFRDGATFEALFASMARKVVPDSMLLLEIGAGQKSEIGALAHTFGWRLERTLIDSGQVERVLEMKKVE